jgi:hypothetical protein
MHNDTGDGFWNRQLHEGRQDLVDDIRKRVIKWLVRYILEHPEESLNKVSAVIRWLRRVLSGDARKKPNNARTAPPESSTRRPTSLPMSDVNPSPGANCETCGTKDTIYLYAEQPNQIDGWVLCSLGHYEPRYIPSTCQARAPRAADPGFTLRTYTHLMPNSPARTRGAIDRVFRDGNNADDGPSTAQGTA